MLVSLARCVLLVELESELVACVDALGRKMCLVCLLRWQRWHGKAATHAPKPGQADASSRISCTSNMKCVFSSARNSLIRYTILILLVGSAKGWACASKYEKIAHPPCGPVASQARRRVSAALPSVISATLHTQLHTRIWPSTPARSTNAACARAQLQTSVTSARLERSSTSGTAMPLSPSTASTFCCNSSAAAAS